MNRNVSFTFAFLVGSLLIYANPSTIGISPAEIASYPEIKKADIIEIDSPTGGRVKPFFEGTRGLVFVLGDDSLIRIDDNLVAEKQKTVSRLFTADASFFSNDMVSFYSSGDINLVRLENEYKEAFVKNSGKSFPLCVIDNWLFFSNGGSTRTGIQYSSCIINADWKPIQLDHEATINTVRKHGDGFEVINGIIFYKRNPIGDYTINTIDDDGNQYNGNTVIVGGSVTYKIDSKESTRYNAQVFDPEGNLFAIKYSSDPKDVTRLYYAGRSWGYTNPSVVGTCTSDNLRIRLRAKVDSFKLGILMAGQKVDVLKVGKVEIIDGVSAPWYKIRNANGIIGWVFGGYIKL